MLRHPCLLAFAVLATLIARGQASAACKMARFAELPITMTGLRPIFPARINGAQAYFVADSGAFFSQITPAKAAEFSLPLRPAPVGLTVRGLGGEERVSLTIVKQFTIADVPVPNVEFLVGGGESGNDTAGLLGQNFLGIADVEYDLANGAIRLFKPSDCRNAILAYWAGPKPYSVVDLELETRLFPRTYGTVFVNGVRMRALFDTGATTSMLAINAARRIGVDPNGPGVIPAGFSHGVGRRQVRTWITPIDSFKIGDETIAHTRLRIGDTSFSDHDMLLGADFFLSHRVYVAKSQHKLYFTYNGGPVFNLSATPQTQGAAPEPADPGAKGADTAGAPKDAEGFSQRGAAFAARRDYQHAIADLTQAMDLAPNEPRYAYERGMAYLGNNQPILAMADLDQALKLKPDDVAALMARAHLRLAARDRTDVLADLAAIDRVAPREADIRLALAGLYGRVDVPAAAIGQFDLWIKAHPEDSRLGQALGGRCWARALAGRDFDKALKDCDGALRITPKNPDVLNSRGLAHLRLGDLDKAIADYDAALSAQPKIAWSLYGRGVARLRKGLTAEGQADIAAATALRPRLPEEAKAHGIAS